ncbi:MAG: serine/threonine protein kinase, partial [Raoultibacter sp.]
MANEQLILNRYRPISEAGSGGFATVQVAWDTRIQRRVAIKCIQLDESQAYRAAQVEARAVYGYDDSSDLPPVSLENLPGLDEARTAAMLSDPNIVGVYDFEIRGNVAYLIMEYVDGVTLSGLLQQYGDSLSLDAVAAIFSSVAHALEM